jgi:hypothetical protein
MAGVSTDLRRWTVHLQSSSYHSRPSLPTSRTQTTPAPVALVGRLPRQFQEPAESSSNLPSHRAIRVYCGGLPLGRPSRSDPSHPAGARGRLPFVGLGWLDQADQASSIQLRGPASCLAQQGVSRSSKRPSRCVTYSIVWRTPRPYRQDRKRMPIPKTLAPSVPTT